MPPARVVFDVTIEGTARKVITVRSALMIDNQLTEPVELKLENNIAQSRECYLSGWFESHIFRLLWY